MNVRITALGVFAGTGPGPVPDFRPREHLAVRKHLKLMGRPVRLGIAAVRAAVHGTADWEGVAPTARGLFVGCAPAGSDPLELAPAIAASSNEEGLDVAAFGELGVPLVHPLWLVKGLSNNILGYAAAYHDIQGVNINRCDGRISGVAAVLDGARAVDEGRCTRAVAGGADSLVGGDVVVGAPTGEGGAFFVLEAGDGPALARIIGGATGWEPGLARSLAVAHGELGAASGVIELGVALREGNVPDVIEVSDGSGRFARLFLAPA